MVVARSNTLGGQYERRFALVRLWDSWGNEDRITGKRLATNLSQAALAQHHLYLACSLCLFGEARIRLRNLHHHPSLSILPPWTPMFDADGAKVPD